MNVLCVNRTYFISAWWTALCKPAEARVSNEMAERHDWPILPSSRNHAHACKAKAISEALPSTVHWDPCKLSPDTLRNPIQFLFSVELKYAFQHLHFTSSSFHFFAICETSHQSRVYILLGFLLQIAAVSGGAILKPDPHRRARISRPARPSASQALQNICFIHTITYTVVVHAEARPESS